MVLAGVCKESFMDFQHDGPLHSVTWSGARNYLALTFAAVGQEPSNPLIIELPPKDGLEHRLDGAKVLAAVLAGVTEANWTLGSNYPSFANGHPYRSPQLQGVDLVTAIDPSALPHGLNVCP
jgi:hypothetical protein